MIEELADQNHALATANRVNELFNGVASHARLQFVLKIFLAE
jgi:hypothetical protein